MCIYLFLVLWKNFLVLFIYILLHKHFFSFFSVSIHITTALCMSCTIFFFLLWPTFTNTIFLAISTDDRFRNMIFFTELGTDETPNRGSYFIIIRRKYKQCEKSITSWKVLGSTPCLVLLSHFLPLLSLLSFS